MCAGAEGIVEGEQARLDFRDRETGNRAGEFFGKHQPAWLALVVFLIGQFGNGDAVGDGQSGLQGIGETRGDIATDVKAVDDDINVMLELFIERRRIRDFIKLTVDPGALEAALHKFGQILAVLTLAAAHDRRQQIKPRAFIKRQRSVDHLADGLAFDRQAGRRRIGHADAGEQQPHVIVDLRHRADGGTGIARGGFLLNRNGRRETVDLVDIRLLHHFQELPRIGRQGFHVAALALGIDRVECQRRFAGPRQTGHDDQAVTWQIDIDVLQIVLARAANGNRLQRSFFRLGH